MIQFISLFSMLIILTGSCLTVLCVKNEFNSELKKCLKFSTNFNQMRKKNLSHLFSLNKKALALRKKRLIAERVYQAAPPNGKAAAYAALQTVKLLQKIFRTYQRSILRKISFLSLRFKTKMLLKKYFFIKRIKNNLVSTYPKNSDSPSYKPSSFFSEKSQILFKKKFSLNKKMPTYFKNLLAQKGYIECGSTITSSKNQHLHLKLLGGKSF